MTGINARIHFLAGLLSQQQLWLATAESCTGGLIGHLLTNEPGSSKWYLGGVVAYSNALKAGLLKVDQYMLSESGAVSSECVLSMARGVSVLTGADVSLAVSGIAGPAGGSPEKPVGTVFLSWHVSGQYWWEKQLFQGDREEIKMRSAERALVVLSDYLDQGQLQINF